MKLHTRTSDERSCEVERPRGYVNAHHLGHARVGQLVLNRGTWDGREVLSAEILQHLLEPAPVNPGYASLWWLNPGRESIPAAPESCVFARGGGANLIVVDAQHDLVLVSRWVDSAHWNTLYTYIAESLAG